MNVSRRDGFTLMEVLVAVSLLSMLSVGILFAMRIGLNAMHGSSERLMANRRVVGAHRALTQQIAGYVPAKALCRPAPDAPPQLFHFFQGHQQTMRFVSTYSLQDAGRGAPRILEYQVIPGEEGRGVRLIVNEILYTGPLSAGALCAGVVVEPGLGSQMIFLPVGIGSHSFVIADKLAHCRFVFKEEINEEPFEIWRTRWTKPRTPVAVTIDMAPLDPDPSKLQAPGLTIPFRANRDPMAIYKDYE